MDVGVARPSAHGQAITRTAINFSRAEAKSPGSAQKYQTKKAITQFRRQSEQRFLKFYRPYVGSELLSLGLLPQL